MLVADGVVATAVALPALYVGIVVGDAGLYGLGRLIALNRISQRVRHAKRFAALKVWLDERLVAGVFVVRFMPGLRLPAYTTYGFFAMPLRRFMGAVVVAAAIWTTGLFYLSLKFADVTQHWLGLLRWPVLIVAAWAPLLLVRHLVKRRLPDTEAPAADAEVQGSEAEPGQRPDIH
nr:VTT domain-containing protein [Oleiagrimonas sp. C23AA]